MAAHTATIVKYCSYGQICWVNVFSFHLSPNLISAKRKFHTSVELESLKLFDKMNAN